MNTNNETRQNQDELFLRKRRLSLEDDFMNYSVDDILFGAMYYLATYHPEKKKLYLTKNNFTKNKANIKGVCGNISTQKLNRHLAKLIEDGLIQEQDMKSGDKTYPSYIFPYEYKQRYQLVENEMLWYIVSTRNAQAVKLYIYLLNKYNWKQAEKDSYIFTNKELIGALGYSTNSANNLANTMVSNVLESLSREGIIKFESFYEEMITTNGKVVPTPKKRLLFVASSKNDLEKI
jgi:hypothetical protein